MRKLEAALPPAFSLLRSEFNDFLYAPIGEERNHMVLTVLSALARLGIDPWDEAARLAQLSREAATRRLTAIIAGLSDGQWGDANAIAGRLVALLPTRRVAASAQHEPLRSRGLTPSRILALLFVAVLSGLAFSTIIGSGHPGPTRPGSAASDAASSPSAPFAGSK